MTFSACIVVLVEGIGRDVVFGDQDPPCDCAAQENKHVLYMCRVGIHRKPEGLDILGIMLRIFARGLGCTGDPASYVLDIPRKFRL